MQPTAVPANRQDVPTVADVEAIAPRARTLPEAFRLTVAAHGDDHALRAGVSGSWYTWNEYAEQAERAAGAFTALGVRRGDVVALQMTNRPEFHFLDLGALMLGALPFSVYNTSSPEQVEDLLAQSGASVFVGEGSSAGLEIARATDGVQALELLDEWPAVLGQGDSALDLEALEDAVNEDDVATLIYTSGTTGPPKGVELTHRAIMNQSRVIPVWCGATSSEESLLSYLPMAHVAERVLSHYLPMLWGWETTCADDPRAIAEVLPEAQPSIFFAPPRFWDKIRSALVAGPLKDAPPTPSAAAPVFDATGFGSLRLGMVAAAPAPPGLIEFYQDRGVPLVEGYGMSECGGGFAIDVPNSPRAGTVGPPLPGFEASLADDGELIIRGPSIMRGYRGRPELTAEVLDADGWLRTGDIASIDDDGRLRIVDRKKELIINAAGKNMSPVNIENKLKQTSPLIGSAVAIGNGRRFNVALIVLDPDAVGGDVATAAHDPAVLRQLAEAVEHANSQLSRVEQIKRYEVLDQEWVPPCDELTPTMKLKRRTIDSKYKSQIEALYAGADEGDRPHPRE